MNCVSPTLNQSGFLERRVRAVFLNGFKSAGGDFYRQCLFKLGNVNPPFLQVKLTPSDASRVELCGAGAIAVPASALRASF